MRVRTALSPSLNLNGSLPLIDREAEGFSFLAAVRGMHLRRGLGFPLGDDEAEGFGFVATIAVALGRGLSLRFSLVSFEMRTETGIDETYQREVVRPRQQR
jgi:hypothetical protein